MGGTGQHDHDGSYGAFVWSRSKRVGTSSSHSAAEIDIELLRFESDQI